MIKSKEERKKEATKMLRKIYKELEDYRIVFVKNLKSEGIKLSGLVEYREWKISIDPWDNDRLISTIIHEGLHIAYPDLSESNVVRLEKMLMNNLSAQQLTNLMKRCFK